MNANTSKHTLQVGGATHHLNELTGIEAISCPFSFTCHVIVNSVTAISVLGQRATLHLTAPDSATRDVHGIVHNAYIKPVLKGKDGYEAVFEVASELSKLSHQGGTRVFFRESAISLAYRLLDEHGILRDQCVEQLQHTYPVRSMLHQLHYESDLAFLRRVLAREGIFFYSGIGSEGTETFHLSDCSEVASFHPRTPLRLRLSCDQEALDSRYTGAFDLHQIYHTVPDEVVVQAYCDAKPSVVIRKSARIAATPKGDRVIRFFEREALDPIEAQRRANIRKDGYCTQKQKITFGSRLPDIRLGVRSRVDEHDIYVHEIRHHVSSEHNYSNEVIGIPCEVSYRDPLVPPKADSVFLIGHVVGTTNNAEGKHYAELDNQGRYQVKLLCDTHHHEEQKFEPWMRRVQPFNGRVSVTGKPTGFHAPLLKGTEVIVGCLGGDPDRLIILGARANLENHNVIEDQTIHSRWRTPSDSEITWVDQPKQSSLYFRTKQGNNKVVLDANDTAPKISIESKQGVVEANAGRLLLLQITGQLEEKVFAQKIEEVGLVHRLQTQKGDIHLQAPLEMTVRVKNDIHINTERNINFTLGEGLSIFPRKSATLMTDAKDITLHVEAGDGVLDSAKNITIVGQGQGTLELSQQGNAGVSIGKDGTITLFGNKILANASNIQYDGKVQRETSGPPSPAQAMIGECLPLRVPEPVDLKGEYKENTEWQEYTIAVDDGFEYNALSKHWIVSKLSYELVYSDAVNHNGVVSDPDAQIKAEVSIHSELQTLLLSKRGG